MLSKLQLQRLYQRRARRYDLTANLYYLIGYREFAYRKRAIRALNLTLGDTVLEICCGTGLNFSLLQDCVGPEGRIIGIDLTCEMLRRAEERAAGHGWSNVELIHTDAAKYPFSERVDGILSTFAMGLVPEYDAVVRAASRALAPGRSFVILDFKEPDGAPEWITRLGVMITRPFGITLDLRDRRPFESMARCLDDFTIEDLYFGLSYIAAGKAPSEA